MSSTKTVGGRILNSFGEGATDAWGARPLGLDQDTETALKKLDVLPDYQAGHSTFLKGVNEAVIRPAAVAVDAAARTVPTVFGGAAAALRQTGREVAPGYEPTGNVPRTPQEAVALGLAAGGELTEAAGQGQIGPETGFTFGRVELPASVAADAARARSLGVIGEGEEGFYGAKPVSPENIQARTDAAHEAGIEPMPPEPPAPDIHALARRIDPETFEQYDALALAREQHRETIATLGEERINSPEALESQGQIDTILGKVNNVPSRLTNAATERLNAAQERLDTILHTDSPEMTAARNGLMNADFAMRDLAPEVSEAYRQAADMMPEKPVEPPIEATGKVTETQEERPATVSRETPETAPGEAPAAPQRTPAEEAGVRAATAAGATPEGLAEVAPANVVGTRETRPAARSAQPTPAVAEAALPASVAAREPTEPVEGGIPAETLRQAAADVDAQKGKLPARENIVQAIKRLGGVKLRNEDGSLVAGPDINGDLEALPHQTRRSVVNNATGLSPERLEAALREEGWFGHGEVKEGALADAIRRQVASKDAFHPESDLDGRYERRATVEREMAEAGVDRADGPAVAAQKLAEWRHIQEQTARKMEILRAEADELGLKHDAATSYDELLADVLERRAIEGELSDHELDAYEDDIDAGLTESDLRELDRIASAGVEAEHGEGAGAFRVSGAGEPAAGAGEGRGELAEGAAGGGEGPAAAGVAHSVAETGETAVRGLARSTEERALERGLDETFGDLPQYRRMSKADQARQVVELMDRDYETAKEIAFGLRNPPHGILPESVFEGVRARALAEGDFDTARQLATHSALTAEATTMGRRIGMLARRDPSDPIAAIRDVQRAREAALGRDIGAATRDTISEIREEVRASASKTEAWRNFLDGITCDGE